MRPGLQIRLSSQFAGRALSSGTADRCGQRRPLTTARPSSLPCRGRRLESLLRKKGQSISGKLNCEELNLQAHGEQRRVEGGRITICDAVHNVAGGDRRGTKCSVGYAAHCTDARRHSSRHSATSTERDAILRLKGKDLPRFAGSGHGDVFLRVLVHVPEHLSPEQRTLYTRLQSMSRSDR